MNEKDILKALECCSTPHTEVKCYCCKSTNVDICSKLNPTIILDLIKRQREEIKKLESKNNTLTIDNAIMKSKIGSLEDDIQTAKSEAIKEFVEKLKNKYVEALKTAIEALEKQMPKKPKDYPLSDGQCPTCNAVFDYDWKPKSRFCQNCGQRLDWSEENG